MGIIIRQSFKTSLVNFVGAVVGMMSVLFIYPLDKEAVGFASNFYSIGIFIAPFIALGVTSLSIKYYPEFGKSESNPKSGFFSFLLLSILVNFIVFSILVSIFKQDFYNLLEKFHFQSSTFSEYELSISILAILLVLISLFTSYISNFGRIVVPSIVVNFGYKIFLPIVILMVYFGYFQMPSILYFVIAFHIIAAMVLLSYLGKLNGLDVKLKDLNLGKVKLKEMISFSLLSGLTGLGGVLAYRLDTIMISGFLGFEATGTYVLPMTMAAVMDIPTMAISGIASPIIVKAFQEDNHLEIENIYKKSSLNLLIIGILILLGGWFCFDDLAKISSNPKAFEGTKYIFLILGMTKMVDMVTSINNAIIAYSKYFKYNLIFVLILGGLNIFLNIKLIPIYGLPGAAYATFISMSLFNLFKLIFIYWKFKIHPFSWPILKLLVIGVLCFTVATLIPVGSYIFFNLLLKAFVITSVFSALVYFTKLSSDLNATVDTLLRRLNAIRNR